MRTTIVSALSATASLIAGVIAPMVIPQSLPEWTRYALLALAGVMYVIAIVTHFSAKNKSTVPLNNSAGERAGRDSYQAGRDQFIVHAPPVKEEVKQSPFHEFLIHVGTIKYQACDPDQKQNIKDAIMGINRFRAVTSLDVLNDVFNVFYVCIREYVPILMQKIPYFMETGNDGKRHIVPVERIVHQLCDSLIYLVSHPETYNPVSVADENGFCAAPPVFAESFQMIHLIRIASESKTS